MQISPDPTDEEAAAIVAAIELAWPRTVLVEPEVVRAQTWRFSGRWWARPIAARRARPYF